MDLESGPSEPGWTGRLERTPFAAALATGAPLIVARGQPPRLAFATPSALAAFGVADARELEPILFSGQGFASRRLLRLAAETPVNAAPRLELLRFFVARRPVSLNWLCARLTRAGESFFVAGEAASRSEGAPAESWAAAALADEAASFQAPALDGPIRFVWSVGAEGRFAAPDAALRRRLGPNAPREGESLDAFLARTGLDADGDLARAWRAQSTFSALRLAWPEPGGARARIVSLSGAPVFAGARQFLGFRGFGIFTGEAVDLAPTLASDNMHAAGEPAPPEPSISNPAPDDAKAADPSPQAPVEEPSRPPCFASAASDAASAATARNPSGGANALIGLLQRQHSAAGANSPGAAAATAPAMAVISALASLLQAKSDAAAAAPPAPAGSSVAPAPAAVETPPSEGGGAEIVMLRPGPSATPANDQVAAPAAREPEAVALTSQERDAFKEIARALGANVRGARGDAQPPTDDEPAEEPPHDEPVRTEAQASQTPESDGAPKPPQRALDDFAGLVDNLPIAALVIRGHETLYANRTLLDLTGYKDLEDFRRRGGLKAIFRGRDPEALATGGAGGGIPLVAAGERVVTVDAQVRPTKWDGAAAVLVAMRRSLEADHEDELRAMEREIDMHAARARDYGAALDAARDGMVRLDRSGRILGMNKGAERLLGYDQKEAAGETFLALLAPASHAAATTALERLTKAESGPVESFEALVRDQTGGLAPMRIDLGRFANQPEPDYFLLISHRTAVIAETPADQTALEDAEHASRAKTELLSRVSHEMRTPLHAIMGFAEVILESRFGPIGNDRYRDYIKDIHASARHVLSLAGDLLDMSKLELGKLDLEFTPIDLNRVIRECVTLMQPQAARERIIMRLSLYDRLPNVMADERSMKQVMINLMSNAVKYNEPGGQVIVSTALDDAGAAIVRVRDTGVGMSDSDLEIALEPFRRVPGAKAVEGSGLGLPLTKALVEANHADFSIKSRKDQGTLVEIAFPAAKAAQ